MRRRPYGPAGWLIDEIDDPAQWAVALRARSQLGVREIVPAHDTVVVTCDRAVHESTGDVIDSLSNSVVAASSAERRIVPEHIDVCYDGVDLAVVADHANVSIEAAIDLHLQPTYTVAFCGFSPGFAYLTGLDERLRIPRRSSPRTSVPAGSVAIAAEYSCVYPSPSPGGWHLLGSTNHMVWDVDRVPPALLEPGRTVRFRRIER